MRSRRPWVPFLASAVVLIAVGFTASCPVDSWDDPIVDRLDGVTLVDAFPRHTFHRPILVTAAPGDADGLYVAEQHGEIWRIDRSEPSAPRRSFANLARRVSRRANEMGLLGLAFHPDYATNGRVFMHYSRAEERAGIIAEFRVVNGVVDEGSEIELLRQPQPHLNHNGGGLAFGPDGFLYISFGDGGSQHDPEGFGQRVDTHLGKILRIDVDRPARKRAWSVPADNPLRGVNGARPAIWAWGLRNVWRFSFDRETGRLWAADVGQNRREEVNIITRGGNYGWPVREGDIIHDASASRGPGELLAPIATYGHDEGRSITGGYVYRGHNVAALRGAYVFADFQSGTVWCLTPDGDGWKRQIVAETRRPISSFGEDSDGELYACAFDGRIYKLVPGAPRHNVLPMKLDDVATDDHIAVPYHPTVPFWSDGLEKDRVAFLPRGSTIRAEDGRWVFPVGTVIKKSFHEAAGTPLEVRVIQKEPEGWHAASYVDLDADGSFLRTDEAVEIPRSRAPSWRVPSTAECWTCHAEEAGFVLGLEPLQMNPGVLAAWRADGILKADDPSEFLPKLESADVRAGARAWLHVNCASCHQPSGRGNAAIDLRFTTPLDQTGLVDVEPAQGTLGVDGARLLAPGHPERSILMQRILGERGGHMPPLGQKLVDRDGAELVERWIQSLSR